jgi:curved DNA-binding protein CbpA
MNYYSILGLQQGCSQEEIKKAYRRLASQHHPDKGGDTSTFQNIQAAYEFLLKTKKVAQEELSWLPINKYSFYPISVENILVLKTNKDIADYIGWLKKNYPVKL